MAKVKITQVRSGIHRPETHKKILRALGLRRHQTSCVHDDSPQIMGMVNKISHLVRVEEVQE